ncbi:MAG: VWA domain-containing protein [Gammaproteobacteria bacterium]|jgi:Ca-activated chloride channel family protein
MPEAGLHFAQPLWLLGLLAIPLVLVWLWRSAPLRRVGQEHKYADPHLLPYLSGAATIRMMRNRRALLGWTLVWSLLSVAMAGPRWGYRHMNPFDPGADLVILLDISRSMGVADVRPSRLERARQEIQDLIRANRGVRTGLVAFATIAHVVTPITDDGESLLRQLPAISPGLVRLQGSRLSGALDRAARLLSAQGDDVAHNILLISDGDFAETGLEEQIRRLRDEGISTHVLAVGSADGGVVPGLIAPDGEPVISRLDEEKLKGLVEAGGGIYRDADYRGGDTRAILDAVLSHAVAAQSQDAETRVWNEYFYLLLVPAMLLVLLLFRPGVNLTRAGQGGEA